MSIEYSLWNPTGNRTILVETPVPAEKQGEVARRLLETEPLAEQVGFVTENRLQMAGGEFCGNAAMSAAARICMEQNQEQGTDKTVFVAVSGASTPLEVKVRRKSETDFYCTVNMPNPQKIEKVLLQTNGKSYYLPLVCFDGMYHLIIEEKMEHAVAETAVRKWCLDLSADGLGLMFFNRFENSLTPLVYVPKGDTLFWESSCASGTTALGAFLAAQSGKKVSLSVKEPAGELKIEADAGKLQLTGSVRLEKRDRIL